MIKKAETKKELNARKREEMKHQVKIRDTKEEQELLKKKIEISKSLIKFGNESERSIAFLKNSIIRFTKEHDEVTKKIYVLEGGKNEDVSGDRPSTI